MKTHSFISLILLMPFFSLAQARVTWGEEFKMHKRTTDLAIIYTDKSGIYLEESHHHTQIGLWSSHLQKAGILVKLDGNMAEQYRNDFDKDLDGKDYDRLFIIKDRMYLFCTDYTKKDKTLHLYAAEIDKATGRLKGSWQEVNAWVKQDKAETVDYNIALNEDSTKVVLTGTYTGRAENRYEIKMMDADLHAVGQPFSISNEFDPKTFQVQDFVYTSSGNAILVGRVYAYEEGRKKKDKNLVFQHYSIRIYDLKGKMVKDLMTDIDGRYLVTGKLKQVNKEMILAAFYSNDRKRRGINGLMVQRIDPASGNVLMTTKQDLNSSLITEVENDDEKSDKKKKKDEDDEDALTANLVFRNFYMAPDNGLVILAEQYTTRIVESTVYQMGSGPNPTGYWRTTVSRYFNFGDLYMSKISLKGDIEWLHVLPKSQSESILLASSMNSTGFYMLGYFDPEDGPPYYCGFSSMAGKRSVHIFFNDHEVNAGVLQPGRKIRRISSYGSSTCYQINLDMLTGTYDRKPLFSNKDIPVAMIRKGSVIGNTMWITGMETRLLGKSKVDVGKIVSAD